MSINQSKKVDLSIIIVSYNTEKITKNCLLSIYKSLKNSSIKFEVIIVDNGSTDNSINMIKDIKTDNNNLIILENKNNLGFAKANNQGVKIAQGKYILFLNSDVIVLNQAIEKMYKFIKQNNEKVSFLGGKLLNKDMTSQPSCGPFYSLPIIFGALFLKGDYWGLTRYSPNQLKEVDWISGACILTKKSSFKTIDGFDKKIFMYMDEVDLLYRAKQKGYRVFFFPQSKFIHLGSASSQGKTYPILQVYQGFLYFYKKHSSPFKLFILKIMLKLKALISISIGYLTNNKYLILTYEKAYKMV